MFFNRKFLKEIALAQENGNLLCSDYKKFYIEMNKSNDEFLRDKYCRIFFRKKNKRIGEANLSICNRKELFINDIRIEDYRQQNKGCGTELLKAVKKITEINNFDRIIGDLSQTDMDHMDKLKYFYSKQDFGVTRYREPKGLNVGKVEYILKKDK